MLNGLAHGRMLPTQFDWRMNVPLFRHWCAYLDLGVSFFNIQTDNSGENIAGAVIDKLFPGLSKIKPSLSTGITYVVEKRNGRSCREPE